MLNNMLTIFNDSNIKFILTNLTVALFILALLFAIVDVIFHHKRNTRVRVVDTFLAYLLLFSVGFFGIFGFVMHAFFPAYTATLLGLQQSPFQLEVALAKLGLGAVGILSFGSSFGFRAATIIVALCFLFGIAAARVWQMIITHNFALGNLGMMTYTNILVTLILLILLILRKNWSKQKTF